MLGGIVVAFTLGSLFQFAVNPCNIEAYAWKSRAVYPGNIDCLPSGNSFHIMCVSNFIFSPAKIFAVQIPDYVNIIYINMGQKGLFMTYNYTGANWTLQAGIQ